MNTELQEPIIIALSAYLVIVLIVTRGVMLDPGLAVFQKIAQTLIVWLVPVIGIAVVLLMQGNNHSRTEMKSLVPFPFYLTAPAGKERDGSLASPMHDAYDIGNNIGSGCDAADGD